MFIAWFFHLYSNISIFVFHKLYRNLFLFLVHIFIIIVFSCFILFINLIISTIMVHHPFGGALSKPVTPGCDWPVWWISWISQPYGWWWHPLSCESRSGHAQEPVFKASLEYRGVTVDPDVAQSHGKIIIIRVGESDTDSEVRVSETQGRNYLLGVLQGPTAVPTVSSYFFPNTNRKQQLVMVYQSNDIQTVPQQQWDLEDYGAID